MNERVRKETQRGQVTCPRPQSWKGVGRGLHPTVSVSRRPWGLSCRPHNSLLLLRPPCLPPHCTGRTLALLSTTPLPTSLPGSITQGHEVGVGTALGAQRVAFLKQTHLPKEKMTMPPIRGWVRATTGTLRPGSLVKTGQPALPVLLVWNLDPSAASPPPREDKLSPRVSAHERGPQGKCLSGTHTLPAAVRNISFWSQYNL